MKILIYGGQKGISDGGSDVFEPSNGAPGNVRQMMRFLSTQADLVTMAPSLIHPVMSLCMTAS